MPTEPLINFENGSTLEESSSLSLGLQLNIHFPGCGVCIRFLLQCFRTSLEEFFYLHLERGDGIG